MRPLDINTYCDEDEFKQECLDRCNLLVNKYFFYFGDMCNEIKDLDKVLKKKKDWYHHKIAIYYVKDECYFVVYRKVDILINVLLDCNGCQIAHYLKNKCSEIHNKRKQKEAEEFEELIKTEY